MTARLVVGLLVLFVCWTSVFGRLLVAAALGVLFGFMAAVLLGWSDRYGAAESRSLAIATTLMMAGSAVTVWVCGRQLFCQVQAWLVTAGSDGDAR